ncbi:unnamed protein product [Fusarium venenatum]|uniref:Uncharacterized protein n=1 Tax=Fusarium venenatum TaxID=56646 RepID=A0A2L2THY9_9HYPO|nr:LOW QUALITY PROTEIN: uncharacterized protein FVRRES_09686 [Fusarium venenatum]CEI69609.1 unnamed protein product [Fusarium venenatum]
MLSQSMEHVVEETNSCVDSNLLRLASLRSMAIIVVEKTGIGVRRKIAAVEVESELDLGLVGVTSESSPSVDEIGRAPVSASAKLTASDTPRPKGPRQLFSTEAKTAVSYPAVVGDTPTVASEDALEALNALG